MLRVGLAFLKPQDADLAALPKGDPRKVALALAIRQQTIVSND